jgi:hypothetical protein
MWARFHLEDRSGRGSLFDGNRTLGSADTGSPAGLPISSHKNPDPANPARVTPQGGRRRGGVARVPPQGGRRQGWRPVGVGLTLP